jgi:uncharacterized protein YoxC
MGGLLERLTQANLTLHSVLNRAGENLDLVEKNLGGRTEEVRSVLEQALAETRGITEQVSTQVAALESTSKNVLHDVADLTLRFDEQARSLTSATNLLSDANRALETTVEERRRSLEELAAGLVDKTQTVETMMHAFAGLVGDTLTTAETRARDVGASLTTAAEEAMRKVLTQLDTLRQTAGTEGQRSAEALRAAQEAMIGEMTRAVSETTGRFAEATDKMREAARLMQTELESTRSELRRGVLELPKETEESTAQLRRVVTDQLKALADLSAMVGRQSANLDVSRASGTRVASVEAAPRYEAPRRPQPAPAPAPVAAAVEQLKVWADRAGADFMSKETGADAAALAFEAVERARAEGHDVVLIDTAGRLQNKQDLMNELLKVIRVIKKVDPEADRKSTRLNSSHRLTSRMPSSA